MPRRVPSQRKTNSNYNAGSKKKPTKKEYGQMLIDHMSQGLSFTSFFANIDIVDIFF